MLDDKSRAEAFVKRLFSPLDAHYERTLGEVRRLAEGGEEDNQKPSMNWARLAGERSVEGRIFPRRAPDAGSDRAAPSDAAGPNAILRNILNSHTTFTARAAKERELWRLARFIAGR